MRVALCFYGTLGGIKGKAGDKEGSPLSVLEKAFPHYKERILVKNLIAFIPGILALSLYLFIHYLSIQ